MPEPSTHAGMPAKISFRNDYSEGAHPRLLQALAEANTQQHAGYGLDALSLRAADLIRGHIESPQAQVHLLAGGTQTNLTAIAAFLRPHEAVVAATLGHVARHETGAIEATGHKVLTVPAPDAKLTPALIEPLLAEHASEHMVKPRLVYISNTTEIGTVYDRTELATLRAFCQQHRLYLYMDGARLGSALAVEGLDLSLPDIAALTDAFYIGGTKNGALLGEALVIVNPVLQSDARYLVKQRGAMLAKGMLLGSQFEALFRDGLFVELGRHANAQAQRLRDAIAAAGFTFASDSRSNQLFPILPLPLIQRLQERYEFDPWQPVDAHTAAVRLVTSWATTDAAVDAFARDFAAWAADDAPAPTAANASA